MKKLRKLFLATGGFAASFAPLATVISCSTKTTSMYDLLPTYTAQADQLIALGIKPGYYPVQLGEKNPFKYITDPASLMYGQSEDFKKAFTNKIKELTPNKIGQSWWNQQALDDGERGSDPEYWQHMGGTLVMYEHYLLDDGDKKISESTAPKHYQTKRNYLETNFRVSRDPFTRMPKPLMQALLDQDDYSNASPEIKKIVNKLLDVARKIEGELDSDNEKAVDGGKVPSGKPQREATDEESWLYNDFVYARNYHTQFLDNHDFQKSSAKQWILNDVPQENWVFDRNKANDETLKKLFFASTFQKEEVDVGLAKLAKGSYTFPINARNGVDGQDSIITPNPKYHHPIYEQQEEIGGAPMFEGAQRDNMLYFYNTAAKLSGAFRGIDDAINNTSISDYDKSAYKKLNDTFKDGTKIRTKLNDAESNANKINTQIRDRMTAIRNIVDLVNNPTFGIVTIAPGVGANTVQTSSKYSFIYNELGFKQPIPKNLATMADNEEHLQKNTPQGDGKTSGTFFNMDDNGWWWNLGAPGSEDFNEVNAKRTGEFKDQFDLGIITTNIEKGNKHWRNMDDGQRNNVISMFKGKKSSDIDELLVGYNVWNEGLKTPFVLHMILDYIVKELKEKYKGKSGITENTWTQATNWGQYFTSDFISE